MHKVPKLGKKGHDHDPFHHALHVAADRLQGRHQRCHHQQDHDEVRHVGRRGYLDARRRRRGHLIARRDQQDVTII